MSLNTIIRYAIVLLCLFFLGYRVVVDGGIGAVIGTFAHRSWSSYWTLVVAIGLLPVNVLFEAMKWRKAIEEEVSVSLSRSLRAVLWGYTGAFITPNSLGEYPTRSMNLPQGVRTQAVAMGFVGSLVQTVVITLFGVVGSLFWLGSLDVSPSATLLLYLAIVLVLILAIVFFVKIDRVGQWLVGSRLRFVSKIAESLRKTKRKQLLQLSLISTLKYTTFSLQFLLMLVFCGVDVPINCAFADITVFYLLLTYTPLINIFEVAVRSSIAIVVFGLYSPSAANIVVASTLFWLINFCLPSLVGMFFFKVKGLQSKN